MKFLLPLYMKLVGFLNDNRTLVVSIFALNYESRFFGKEGSSGKYLRAVLPILICFYFAIWSTLILDGFDIWPVLNDMDWFFKYPLSALFVLVYLVFWVPVIVCWWIGFSWFKKGYFELFPLEYEELTDNSQEWQMLNKPFGTGMEDETYPQGTYFAAEYKSLKGWHDKKFEGEGNVDAWLGILPFAILILGALIAVLIMS